MAEFLVERSFTADADAVWSKLGDFAGLGDWMPGIAKNEVEGEGVGAVRRLYFNETTCVVEKLEALDEGARSLSYSITEGPAPVVDYLATVEVEAEGDGCKVAWRARFDTPDGVDAEAVKPALSGAYRGALEALARLVEA
jgi:carbon monoxide dehydrogenase subunit G